MNLKKLEQAIKDINVIHKNVSEVYFNSQSELDFPLINLKSKTVSHFFEDSNQKLNSAFLKYIYSYYYKLYMVIAVSSFESDYVEWDARIRVKQKESIQNKLNYYYISNSEHGGVPIQKCLNDMLGYRLIIDDFDPYSLEFIELMERLKSELSLMKWYTRDKDGYIGTHIYFKNGNNVFFPWELQIWNSADMERNEESHAEHKAKRKYTKWPKTYKDASIRKDD